MASPGFVTPMPVAYNRGVCVGFPVPNTLHSVRRRVHRRSLSSQGILRIGRLSHSATTPTASLAKGDTVAIVGATGGVGRMLVRQLLSDDMYNVRAIVRNPDSAKERFARDFGGALPDSLSIVPGDITREAEDPHLAHALEDANAVVISVGTTAFPTKAWGPGFRNSPDRVDRLGSENVVRALDPRALRKVVLVSSIGTMRRGHLFFWILNLCGVLNAKRRAEEAVAAACEKLGCTYAIVRPGRLIGGPHTNPGEHQKKDLARQVGIKIAKGDSLIGEISRTACALAVKHTLDWKAPASVDFSVIHSDGSPPSKDSWHSELDALV